jgi:hypothetical protein
MGDRSPKGSRWAAQSRRHGQWLIAASDPRINRSRNLSTSLAGVGLIDQCSAHTPCPIRCISSLVAPDEAANTFPMWCRSGNRKPPASPASATHSGQRADQWKLFRRPLRCIAAQNPADRGGNSARCPAAAIANARPLPSRPVPAYECVRVRSRRALATACPYPSLLK